MVEWKTRDHTSVYGFWYFLTSFCIKFDTKKNQFTVCMDFDIFFMTSVSLNTEAFYVPLDDILPLFDDWRRYLYEIWLKKAFVDHEIGLFCFHSTWMDSTEQLEGLYS